MKRVPYETMVKEFKRVLVKKGFSEKRGEAAAEIFAQNSLAGVYSHRPIRSMPPQAGIFGMVLDQQIPMHPWSAAWKP